MSDPITREASVQEPTIEQLEEQAMRRAAEQKASAADELSIMDLEAEVSQNAIVVPPPEMEDDGFINNTWEVTGSAVEQAAEQVVRTLYDVTSFADATGPQLIWGDAEYVDPDSEDQGIPIWGGKRIDIVSGSRFKELSRDYEIATGKETWNLGDFNLPDVDRPDSPAGQMAEGFLRWAVVFAATRKATGVGNIAGSVIADFTAFDPHEARLADLVSTWGEGNPVFDNAVTEWLSADPTDSEVEGRLKNAIEGLGLGLAMDGVMASLRWMRGYRAAKQAAGERRLKDDEILEPEGPRLDLEVDEDEAGSILMVARRDEPRPEPLSLDENVVLGTDELGKIELQARPGQGRLQVVNSALDPDLQGQGFGKQMYDDAAKMADERGLELVSDNSVSGAAARVWESMAKRGDDIIDMRKTDPDNIDVQVREDGTKQYWSKNGEPIFQRKPKGDFDATQAARDTVEGTKVKETLHDVAARRLKASLKADPAKLRAVKGALESGNLSEATDLIDFNSEAVDWEGLLAQMGTGNEVNELRKLINTVSEVFEAEMKDAKGYQSMAETVAKSVGATADDVLKLGADVKGGKGLAARMAGADTMVYQSAQHLRKLARKANESGSDKDMMAFYRHIDLHATLQAVVKGSKSEIARALHQMRSVSTQNIEDFAEFDELMRNATGLNGDQRRKLAQSIADLKDANAINQKTRRTRMQRWRDMFIEVYINGLLSGISTLMLNNTSNTLKLIEGITERYFAATVGLVKAGARKAVGKEAGERIMFREANAYVYGTLAGLDAAMRIPFKNIFDAVKADGVKGLKGLDAEEFGTVWRAFGGEKPVLDTRMRVDADTRKAITVLDESDISISESLRTMNLKGVDWNAKAVNSLGKLVRIPGRLILTSDEFFKQITYNQHIAAQAYKHGDAVATAKGLKGKKRQAVIERMHRTYMEFPPEDIRFEAMDHARYQTFQSDLPNGMARDFETFINRNPMMKVVIPFYRTPVNIIKQTIFERTPIPFLKGHKAELFQRIAKGGPEGDIALARLATGSIFIGWGVSQALNGNITGGGLTTSNRPNSQQLDNIPPYSIKVGNKWYQYNRLEPLGMLMGLAADIATASEWYQEGDENTIEEAMAMTLTVITANVTDKTWFKGVADLVSAIEDPKRFAPRYLKNTTRVMVTPYSSLLRRINVDHDELAREAWTWMDNWKANVPGFSEDLPVRYDILGQPVYKRDYLGPAWASPIAKGVERDDPVYKELARLEFDYTNPPKDLFSLGRPVTADVYSEVMRLKGEVVVSSQSLHQRLENLMNSGPYINMLSDRGRADAVKGVISGYLRAAKAEYLRQNPDFLTEFKERKKAIGLLRIQQ